MPKTDTQKAHPYGAGHAIIEGTLGGPALHLDLAAEAKQLRMEETWRKSGHNAKTLVKHPDFRVVLSVLKAGNRVKEHKAEARISIQTLAGRLRLRLDKDTVELPAGHLLALDRALEHDVEAIEDSVFLLSISWPQSR